MHETTYPEQPNAEYDFRPQKIIPGTNKSIVIVVEERLKIKKIKII